MNKRKLKEEIKLFSQMTYLSTQKNNKNKEKKADKLLEVINDYEMVVRYKVDMQKLTGFLHICNQQSEFIKT